MIFCTNCGSENHSTHDCTKPKAAAPFVPPAPVALEGGAPPPPPPPPPESPTYTPPCATAPLYCSATRLPSFPTEKAAKSYEGNYCPGLGLTPAPCAKCGGHHLTHKPEEPTPNETGWRQSKTPFLRAETAKAIAARQRAEEDRCAKAKEPKPERRVALPKPKPDNTPSLFG